MIEVDSFTADAAADAGGRLVAVLGVLADAEMDCVVVFERATDADDTAAAAAGTTDVGTVAGGLFSGADSTTVAVAVVVVGSVDPAGVEVGTNNMLYG